jgi:hypothetical protein
MKTYNVHLHLSHDAKQLVDVIKYANDRNFVVDNVKDFRLKIRTLSDKRSDVEELIKFLSALDSRYVIFVSTYFGTKPQKDLSPLIHGSVT